VPPDKKKKRSRERLRREPASRAGAGPSPDASSAAAPAGPGAPAPVASEPKKGRVQARKGKSVDPADTTRLVFGLFRVGRIDFIGRRRLYAVVSGLLLVVSVLSLALQGLNYGIDFTGGNSFNLMFSRPVQEAEVRAVLSEAGVASAVVRVDRDDPSEVLLRTPYLESEAEEAMLATLEVRLGEFTVLETDVVSPSISGELLRAALLAILLACAGILVYVALRFEYRFGASGILALVHDTVVTLGVFSLLRLEVNSAFVAAILTIIGYSINDTIVVFDRLRENLKRRGKETLEALANRSVNETLVRSINTSVTAFLAITAIYLFGGTTTRDFALALMVGIIVGTYSSICVATPVWLAWRKRDERARGALQSRALTVRR